jgi:hypothetical protein
MRQDIAASPFGSDNDLTASPTCQCRSVFRNPERDGISVSTGITSLSSLRRGAIGKPLFPPSPLSSSPCRSLPILPYFILIQSKIREYKRREAIRLLRALKKNKGQTAQLSERLSFLLTPKTESSLITQYGFTITSPICLHSNHNEIITQITNLNKHEKNIFL